jgi:hypothetical protein
MQQQQGQQHFCYSCCFLCSGPQARLDSLCKQPCTYKGLTLLLLLLLPQLSEGQQQGPLCVYNLQCLLMLPDRHHSCQHGL